MPDPYKYELSNVPATCTMYENGQRITLWYEGEPPQSTVLNYNSPCVGITATLIEE